MKGFAISENLRYAFDILYFQYVGVMAPIKRPLSRENTSPSQKSTVFFCRDIIQKRDKPLFFAYARDFKSFRCGSLIDLLPGKLAPVWKSTNFDAGLYDITSFVRTDIISIYPNLALTCHIAKYLYI